MELYNPIPPIEQAYFSALTVKDEAYKRESVSFFFRERTKPLLLFFAIAFVFVIPAVFMLINDEAAAGTGSLIILWVIILGVNLLITRAALSASFTVNPLCVESKTVFFENCFVVQDGLSSVTMRYEAITSVIETGKYFYIFRSRDYFFTVLKSGFELGYPEQMASFLQNKLYSRYKKKF